MKVEKPELQQCVEKIRKKPEARKVTLTDESNLLIDGRKQVLLPNYVISCPHGLYWGLNGEKSSEPFGSGLRSIVLSESKCLILSNDESGLYFSQKKRPLAGEYLLLLLMDKNFVEFTYIDENMPTFLKLLQHPSLIPQLVGLTTSLIKARCCPKAFQNWNSCCERWNRNG